MLRVGLTGGTGSGKSTLARRLAGRGAVVVDADALAREVVAPGTPGLAAVAAAFGDEVLAPDGSLDRAALAGVVFGDEGRRRALEAITHPLIARRTGELVAAAPADGVLVHDVPLLVEKRMAPGYHLVVVVDAPVEDRVRRLVGRGLPEDDARRRIASQATDDDRRAVADAWVDNTGSADDLDRAADRLWDERLAPFRDLLVAGRPAQGPVPAGAADRLAARLRVVLGDLAGAVEVDGERVRVAVAAGVDTAVVVGRLAPAGVVPVAGLVVLGSCDPGAPVRVHVGPADQAT